MTYIKIVDPDIAEWRAEQAAQQAAEQAAAAAAPPLVEPPSPPSAPESPSGFGFFDDYLAQSAAPEAAFEPLSLFDAYLAESAAASPAPPAAPTEQVADSPDAMVDRAAELAGALTDGSFVAANKDLADTVANALVDLTVAADTVDAAQLAPAMAHWIRVAEGVFKDGEWIDDASTQAASGNVAAQGATPTVAPSSPAAPTTSREIFDAYLAGDAWTGQARYDAGQLPPSIVAEMQASGTPFEGRVYLVNGADSLDWLKLDATPLAEVNPETHTWLYGMPAEVQGRTDVFGVHYPDDFPLFGGLYAGVGLAEPSLAGLAQAPGNSLAEINELIDNLGRDNGVPEERLPELREAMYSFDPLYGVLVPEELAQAGLELHSAREEPSFMEKAVRVVASVGIGVLTGGLASGFVASLGLTGLGATVVTQGIGAAFTTAITGGDGGDFLKSWAGGVVASGVFDSVSTGVSGTLVEAGVDLGAASAAGKIAGNFAAGLGRELITTGEVDLAGLAGGALGAGVATGMDVGPIGEGALVAAGVLVATGDVSRAVGSWLGPVLASAAAFDASEEPDTVAGAPEDGPGALSESEQVAKELKLGEALFDDDGQLMPGNARLADSFVVNNPDPAFVTFYNDGLQPLAAAGGPTALVNPDIPAELRAAAQLATGAVRIAFDGQLAATGSATAVNVGGEVVIFTANHVFTDAHSPEGAILQADGVARELGDGMTMTFRLADGRSVDIPLTQNDGVVSSAAVTADGKLTFRGPDGEASEAYASDGMAIRLPREVALQFFTPEQLQALPTLSAEVPAPGEQVYLFGFPAYTNANWAQSLAADQQGASAQAVPDSRMLVGQSALTVDGEEINRPATAAELHADPSTGANNAPLGSGASGGGAFRMGRNGPEYWGSISAGGYDGMNDFNYVTPAVRHPMHGFVYVPPPRRSSSPEP